ncbi:MAG: hypothetical protein M1503_11800 [Thaumarchaeota archaeon]|nr:hypothetical protein [Nitrososphaerota archaeon]
MLLAAGMFYYAYSIRNTFRGSILWRPLQVFGISPMILVLGELFDIISDILEINGGQPFRVAHRILETGFMVLLLFGFYLFYRAWRPPTAVEMEAKNKIPNLSIDESVDTK